MTVSQFCAKYGLAPPKKISAKKGIDSEVYSDVVRRIYNNNPAGGSWKWILWAGTGVIVVGGAVALFFYLKKK